MARFAINNIPQIDEVTLLKLIDMINITGNFNTISRRQLFRKMNLLLRLVPGTCQYSLQTMIELLDLYTYTNILEHNHDDLKFQWKAIYQ